MKTYGEWAPQLFISALNEDKLLALRPGHFIPDETAPGTHCLERCVAPGLVST
jgi:hypothetical protein